MRIIAGEMRSRRLKAPEGMDTRPTADKVKDALFSILLRHVPGARVLDLYAGSGALSLEAISRGAASAVLADCSQKACKIIAENIESLGCQDRARLLRQGDSAALALLKKEGAQFDLIFLDPPYRMNMSDVCARLEKEGILSEDGIIIVEHDKENAPTPPDTLTLVDRREYGITGLSFFKRTGEE